uniref:Uncharacterized protein n=1 Tax=Opuntia streptacantha TaxID=393608 RepID=A0A7C8Z829_OPUST
MYSVIIDKRGGFMQAPRNNITFGCRRRLRIDISLQKSSMFSGVRSCSRKTLIATSVPFQIPRNTSPKKPIPTRVPTVNSEKSIFHSSYGSRDLWNVCAPTILFHVETISSLGLCSDLKFLSKFRMLYPCGDEGKDIAF